MLCIASEPSLARRLGCLSEMRVREGSEPLQVRNECKMRSSNGFRQFDRKPEVGSCLSGESGTTLTLHGEIKTTPSDRRKPCHGKHQ